MLLCRAASSLCLQLRTKQVLPAARLFSAGGKPPDKSTPPANSERGRRLRGSGINSSSSGSSSGSSSVRRISPGCSPAEWSAIKKSQALTAHIGKLGWQGRWQDVLLALDTAESNGQKLYTNNLSAAIAALTRSKQPEQALQLSVLMQQRGFKIDVVTYNSLIDANSKSGQWQQAIEVLRAMDNQNVKPTTESCNAAINACSVGTVAASS
jgi:pentatricopeptide repeat protein